MKVTVLEHDLQARQDLARRLLDVELELRMIHDELQSPLISSGSDQMYCETHLERARELVGGCFERLRR